MKKLISFLMAAALLCNVSVLADFSKNSDGLQYELYDFSSDVNAATFMSSAQASIPSGFVLFNTGSSGAKILNNGTESYIDASRVSAGAASHRVGRNFASGTYSDKLKISFSMRSPGNCSPYIPIYNGNQMSLNFTDSKCSIKSGLLSSSSEVALSFDKWNDDSWHYYSVEFDFPNHTLEIYYDGAKIKSLTLKTTATGVSQLSFGDYNTSGTFFIDDVQITNNFDAAPGVVKLSNNGAAATLNANEGDVIKYATGATSAEALAGLASSPITYNGGFTFADTDRYVAAKTYKTAYGTEGALKVLARGYYEVCDFADCVNEAFFPAVADADKSINEGFGLRNTKNSPIRIYNDGQESYINGDRLTRDGTSHRIDKPVGEGYKEALNTSFRYKSSDSANKTIVLRESNNSLSTFTLNAGNADSVFLGGNVNQSKALYFSKNSINWNDGAWHEFRFEFHYADKYFKIYFDDMLLSATDGKWKISLNSTFTPVTDIEFGDASQEGLFAIDDFQLSNSFRDMPSSVEYSQSSVGIALSATGADVIHYAVAESAELAKNALQSSPQSYLTPIPIETNEIYIAAKSNLASFGEGGPLKIYGPISKVMTKIVFIEEIAQSFNVEYGTALSSAGLPTSCTAYTDNNDTVSLAIEWAKGDYNPYNAATYSITGTAILPDGYVLDEGATATLTALVTVKPDLTPENLASVTELAHISPYSVLATGGTSTTDTLQLGIAAGCIDVSASGVTNPENVADSLSIQDIGQSAQSTADSYIDVAFNNSYDGERTLDAIKIFFSKQNNAASYSFELLYKKENETEFTRFYKTSMNDTNGATGYTAEIHPTVALTGFGNQITDISVIRIKLKSAVKIDEVDLSMKNDGTSVQSERSRALTPLSFGKLYSDGAILQRDKELKLWGYGGADGDDILLELLNGNNVVRTATVKSSNHRWSAILPGVSGGHTVYTLRITDLSDTLNTAEVSNIVFGDLFIAAGQSNMEMTLSNTVNQLNSKTVESAIEAQRIRTEADTNAFNEVRVFNQSNVITSLSPLEDAYTGSWISCNSYANASGTSAVAYFFAKELYEKLDREIPVGVMLARRGGTKIKAWMPESHFDKLSYGDANKELTDYNRSNYLSYRVWTGGYNALVAPLAKSNIKGVIWYQGEDDTDIPENYKKQFCDMTAGWRAEFGDENISFNTVQLSAYGAAPNDWATFRQTQLQLWQMVNNTNLAVTIDIGDRTDIHPIYKAPVGNRLALTVAANVYGKTGFEWSGPLFKKLTKNGNEIVVEFTHADSMAAKVRENPYCETFTADSKLQGFEISADGATWLAGDALVSGNTVRVSASGIENPAYVRYAWGKYPENNLYNSSNLPAVPFMASIIDAQPAPSVTVENGMAAINGRVKDTQNLKNTAALVIARYDDNDRLIGITVKDISCVINEQVSFEAEEEVKNAAKIYAFVLENTNTIRPLTLRASGI